MKLQMATTCQLTWLFSSKTIYLLVRFWDAFLCFEICNYLNFIFVLVILKRTNTRPKDSTSKPLFEYLITLLQNLLECVTSVSVASSSSVLVAVPLLLFARIT